MRSRAKQGCGRPQAKKYPKMLLPSARGIKRRQMAIQAFEEQNRKDEAERKARLEAFVGMFGKV